jgi:hypothetical protein
MRVNGPFAPRLVGADTIAVSVIELVSFDEQYERQFQLI